MLLLVGATSLLLLSACGGIDPEAVPLCPRIEETAEDSTLTNALPLMIQTVPEAALYPCIESLRPGWEVTEFDAERGRTTISLSSDRLGTNFLRVQLKESCVVQPALRTAVRADETGTELWLAVSEERRGRDREGHYRGSWYYLFDGGCVEYHFDAEGPEVDEIAGDVRDALSFFEREPLDDLLEREIGIRP
jgi:hypothetical protein